MPDSGDYDGSIAAVLEEVRKASALEGLAVLDLSQDSAEQTVSYSAGVGGRSTIIDGHGLLIAHPGGPAHMIAPDKRPVLSCPWRLPPSRSGGLILWRRPRARAWAAADHRLAAALAVLVRTSIATGIGQAGIDRLTGLPNRRWFIDEVDRHIDRLDLDGLAGTLSLTAIDNLRQLAANAGTEACHAVLVRLGNQLRAMVRPADIVARVGAGVFAVWQTGMDHLTAAERADALCAMGLFQDLSGGDAVTLSVGIACREFGSDEDVRALLVRAQAALDGLKRQGGGGWRVSHQTPLQSGSRPST